MAKRITESRVVNWIKDNPKTSGLTTGGVVIGVALISLLFSLGVVTVDNYHSNEYCGGDVPCFVELYDVCFNEDVFIYPMDGSMIIGAEPSDVINDYRLYRGWGDGWRQINLSKPCTGTWCGKPSSVTIASYVYAFRKDKCYDLRAEVDKPENSTIHWSINPDGDWLPLDDLDVKEKLVYVDNGCVIEYYNAVLSYPIFENYTNENGTLSQEVKEYKEKLIIRNRTVCNPFIFNGETEYHFRKDGYECKNDKVLGIVCDSYKDGNGDGVCSPNGGETCCKVDDSLIPICKNSVKIWTETKINIKPLEAIK